MTQRPRTGISRPSLVIGSLENFPAAALGVGQGRAERPIAIRRPGDRTDIVIHSGKLFGRERSQPREEDRQPRPALPAQTGIGAFPLEGGGVEDAAERAVIHGADADAVGLDVVGQAVNMAVRVAGVAGELAAEGDGGVVEHPLAEAGLGDFGRAAEVDAIDGLERRQVDDGQRIVEGTGDEGPAAVGRNQDAARVGFGGDVLDDEFGTLAEMVGDDMFRDRIGRSGG